MVYRVAPQVECPAQYVCRNKLRQGLPIARVQRAHSRNHLHARGYGNGRGRDHVNRVCGRLT